MKKLLVAGAAVLGASVALAAEPLNVNGTWVGVVNLPNGQKLPFVAHLKQQGESVSGVLDGINGAPDVPIQQGMISDGTLTFTGVRVINNQNVTFNYTVTSTGAGGLHFKIARAAGGQALESTTRRLAAMP
jgi:hypothetical protein